MAWSPGRGVRTVTRVPVRRTGRLVVVGMAAGSGALLQHRAPEIYWPRREERGPRDVAHARIAGVDVCRDGVGRDRVDGGVLLRLRVLDRTVRPLRRVLGGGAGFRGGLDRRAVDAAAGGQAAGAAVGAVRFAS